MPDPEVHKQKAESDEEQAHLRALRAGLGLSGVHQPVAAFNPEAPAILPMRPIHRQVYTMDGKGEVLDAVPPHLPRRYLTTPLI